LDPASQAKWEERLQDPTLDNLIPTWESMASFLEQRCRTLETINFAMANYAPTWDSMASFLEQRCRTLETINFAMENYAPGNQVGRNRIPNARRSAFVASNAYPWICVFCNDAGHSISYCQNFKILSPANRLQEAKRLGLCINCLKVGRQVRQCNSSSCRACGSKHHTLLHLGNSPSFPSQEGAQLQEALPSASPAVMPSTLTALIAQEFSNDIVLLATASVLVKNLSGVFVA